jgi:hypothetical protein
MLFLFEIGAFLGEDLRRYQATQKEQEKYNYFFHGHSLRIDLSNNIYVESPEGRDKKVHTLRGSILF